MAVNRSTNVWLGARVACASETEWTMRASVVSEASLVERTSRLIGVPADIGELVAATTDYEERIDEMIASKSRVAGEIIGGNEAGETLLTEMDNDTLLQFVKLDLHQATDG